MEDFKIRNMGRKRNSSLLHVSIVVYPLFPAPGESSSPVGHSLTLTLTDHGYKGIIRSFKKKIGRVLYDNAISNHFFLKERILLARVKKSV